MSAITTPSGPVPPPALRDPSRIRRTVTEFNRMGDMGWFEGKRAFLPVMASLWSKAQWTATCNPPVLMDTALRAIFGRGMVSSRPVTVKVDEYNDPLP